MTAVAALAFVEALHRTASSGREAIAAQFEVVTTELHEIQVDAGGGGRSGGRRHGTGRTMVASMLGGWLRPCVVILRALRNQPG
jgi:hypothetical protein